MDAPAAGGDAAPPTLPDYLHATEALTKLYKTIDKSLLSMPKASVRPFLVYLWTTLKFEFAILGDFFLIVPINFVILIRNIFPGRWAYKSFSWPYLHYAYSWVAAGECYVSIIFVQPLTAFFLYSHFRNRLTILRRRLLLEQSISETDQKSGLSKIDAALNLWESTTINSVLFTYVLPAIGPVIEVCRWLVPASLPEWTGYLVTLSISYALSFFGTAFLVKRGLMLGATGRSAYFPGTMVQPGAYATEREIFNKFGVILIEFPVDIAVYVIGLFLSLITFKQQLALLNVLVPNGEQSPTELYIYEMLGIFILVAAIIVVAWRRRKKLQRL